MPMTNAFSFEIYKDSLFVLFPYAWSEKGVCMPIIVIYWPYAGDVDECSQGLPPLSDFSHVTAVDAEPFL